MKDFMREFGLLLAAVLLESALIVAYAVRNAEAYAPPAIVFKTERGCDKPCAQTLMPAQYTFSVQDGKWPEPGAVIRCRQSGRIEFTCDGGLTVLLEKITFRQ